MKKPFKTTISLLLVVFIIFSLLAFASCDNTPDSTLDPVDDNYRTFYQVFVGSFSDANGDGFGDLRGLINRLDYLNDGDVTDDDSLGVQGLWLSPIFSSPSYHKYDAKDYYKIDWRFGEEKDLVELVNLCHDRNVKVILDLVLNHTSNQHEWFVQFKQARMNGDVDNKYYDYYTCVTATEQVSGRKYQKIAGVDCYYECNFDSAMPELNYDNPEVYQEMLNVAKHYLALGVDGFRFDAVKYIYFGDTTRSVDFWERYMADLRQINPEIYCVGECWSGETEVLQYYPAMDCFDFAMSMAEGKAATAAKGRTAISIYTNYVVSMQDKIQATNPNGMWMPFLSNHDMDRIAGTFVTENNMRMAANLYLLTHGSPFIYYGEEIGMRGSRGGANTDANRRLAMLWGDGDFVRDPVGATYPTTSQIQTTVADQILDENSLYNYYCKLLAIRHKYPAIARGDYTAVATSNNKCGGFLVEYDGDLLLIIHNVSMEELAIDLSKCDALDDFDVKNLCETIGVGNAMLEDTTLIISGQTSVIIKPRG